MQEALGKTTVDHQLFVYFTGFDAATLLQCVAWDCVLYLTAKLLPSIAWIDYSPSISLQITKEIKRLKTYFNPLDMVVLCASLHLSIPNFEAHVNSEEINLLLIFIISTNTWFFPNLCMKEQQRYKFYMTCLRKWKITGIFCNRGVYHLNIIVVTGFNWCCSSRALIKLMGSN